MPLRRALAFILVGLSLAGCALPDGALTSVLDELSKEAASTKPGGASASDGAEPAAATETRGKTAAQPDGTKALAAFKAKLLAAQADPRAVARLFVAALVTYETAPELGRAEMTLMVVDADVRADEQSPSGLGFIAAREILFRALDADPALGRVYLDAPEAGDGEDVESHAVIDEEYKAVGTGVDEEAGTAKFFFKLNAAGNGKRSRPISLRRVDGAWRVSEYSSLFVQI